MSALAEPVLQFDDPDAIGDLRLPRPYIPVDPSVKQDWFLRQDALEAFFGGAAGPGKLLSVRTTLPTPSGWTTIGELRVGDEVFGEDGKSCVVEWLSDIDLRPESYRLTFDDGSEIEACADHLWLTFDAKELAALTRRNPAWRARRRARRASRAVAVPVKPWVSVGTIERNRAANPSVTLSPPSGSVRTTREIADSVVDARGRRNHAVQVAQPLELPEADLPLDPYVLGAWLGDGTTKGGTLTAHPDDHPHFYEHLAAYSPHPIKDPKTIATYGLHGDLRRAGLLGNKHVPNVYMRGSIAQRLALLQGLMDTDGYVDAAGCAEFTSTLERLAVAVHELACSLGQKPTIAEGRATLNGEDYGPKWRVTWTPTIPVFRLERKLVRQNAAPRRTNRFRYIVSCEPIAPRPMRCIRVSNPSSLFLVGRTMIPTHNSWALLMAALQYVDVEGYKALLLRPSITEFEQPGGLIEVAHDWLDTTPAFWNGSRREWAFPSGAKLRFGYLANEGDMSVYKGPSYSFCGFDELTSFTERLYRMMFRVLRQPREGPLTEVPLRMRSASNPGDRGHAFVKARFVEPKSRQPGAVYIAARIGDNPFLDVDAYLESLAHLSPVDRERLINGDWDVMEEGGKFKRDDFKLVDANAADKAVAAVRYWDLAATEVSAGNPDPDWTVGLRLERTASGRFVIRHIVRGRWGDDEVEQRVRATAEADGRAVPQYIEQEPGASGKSLLGHYQRRVLSGYACYKGMPRGGDKEVRSRPVAAAVANGLVDLVVGNNVLELLDECAIFPNGAHDDIVDALSGAHTYLTKRPDSGGRRTSSPARARIPGVRSEPPPGTVRYGI